MGKGKEDSRLIGERCEGESCPSAQKGTAVSAAGLESGQSGADEEAGFGQVEFEGLTDHAERAGRQVGTDAPGVRGEAQAGGVNLGTFKARG